MSSLTRLPALPLVANDPYFSYWCPADRWTDVQTAHWSGPEKPLLGRIIIDGKPYRFLGTGDMPAMETLAQDVTPTETRATFQAGGVTLTARFITPALPQDVETLSTPVTMLDVTLSSCDGKAHQASLTFTATASLCYDGDQAPALMHDTFEQEGLQFAYLGQAHQKLLCHSGDHITIDWGYLYLAAKEAVIPGSGGITWTFEAALSGNGEEARSHLLLGYDDVASILYFGEACKAWYARGGKTLPAAMAEFHGRYDELLASCAKLDAEVLREATDLGGADYALIVSAAWRHTFAAHKLIATPAGHMAFLSKENDSNGCIGTVDISYPSSPLFLRYNPRLVEALCRPVLEFASMPVWQEDFAPHDIGRYPYANGQVYASMRNESQKGRDYVIPPYYLYPAGKQVYDPKYQMPVEESGNMLILLAAAAKATGDISLARAYRPLLDRWVKYLERYGSDPGEQLCTDDFAGHLAHNVNLSAKAIVGIACYGRLLSAMGEDGGAYQAKAAEMALDWYARAKTQDATALTFTGEGWSQKYNLVWDQLMNLGLLPTSFYKRETESYLGRMNTYGLPLDSRADYTKSDWIAWSASMTQDNETLRALLAPVARYLRESTSRVAFGDWYDTKTGKIEHFIARAVQGGMFMPILRSAWRKEI